MANVRDYSMIGNQIGSAAADGPVPTLYMVERALNRARELSEEVARLADSLCGGYPRTGQLGDPAPGGLLPGLSANAEDAHRSISEAQNDLRRIAEHFGIAP